MQLGKLRKDAGKISDHVLGASVALSLFLPAAPSSALPSLLLPLAPPSGPSSDPLLWPLP